MPHPILQFLSELKLNNTREWMAEHKADYEVVKALRDITARNFIDAVAEVEPEAAGFPVKDCVYRFMRDTRFSYDKTPYKTHVGIFVCPPLGKKSVMAGYYLHIEPGQSFICGGNYELPTKYLTAIRNDIRDNIEEYIDIVESAEFKQYFPKVGENPLKTAPKGFPRDWEYLDYVRPREYAVVMPLADSFFDAPGFMERLMPVLEQIKRFNDFINFTLTESGLPLLRPQR